MPSLSTAGTAIMKLLLRQGYVYSGGKAWTGAHEVVTTIMLNSIALFGTLSVSFFPPQNNDFTRVNITMAPGTTLQQTEVVADQVAALVAKDPSVERVFERINVGTGSVNIVLKKDREVTSTEFERGLSPKLA